MNKHQNCKRYEKFFVCFIFGLCKGKICDRTLVTFLSNWIFFILFYIQPDIVLLRSRTTEYMHSKVDNSHHQLLMYECQFSIQYREIKSSNKFERKALLLNLDVHTYTHTQSHIHTHACRHPSSHMHGLGSVLVKAHGV